MLHCFFLYEKLLLLEKCLNLHQDAQQYAHRTSAMHSCLALPFKFNNVPPPKAMLKPSISEAILVFLSQLHYQSI
jgi:hypothetical protein